MPKNLVIIGAGPAGEAAAVHARHLMKSGKSNLGPDAEIILIEKDRPGGVCLNRGCIPSKAFLERVHQTLLSGKPVDWKALQSIKTEVVSGIVEQMAQKFSRLKIKVVTGVASFVNDSTVKIRSGDKEETLSFDRVVLAAGSEIFIPAPFDAFRQDILDSDRLLDLQETPPSVVVVGGGAVGCEFACLLHAAKSRVTLIEMQSNLLPGEDTAVAGALEQSFKDRGINVRVSTTVSAVEKTSSGWKLKLSSGETLEPSQLLVCVGRAAMPALLHVETAGVKLEKNRLVLNEKLQTSNSKIFAAGDVAGARLAHHAAHQGEVAAENALGGSRTPDERFIPRALYSWPEVASVGAWKYELEAKGIPVKATRAFFKGSSKALASGETEGFVQLVSHGESGQLLGAQIIGAHATELIHIISIALKAGMTTTALAEVMFAHPTLAESIKEATKK